MMTPLRQFEPSFPSAWLEIAEPNAELGGAGTDKPEKSEKKLFSFYDSSAGLLSFNLYLLHISLSCQIDF